MEKEKIKLITSEENFKNILKILREDVLISNEMKKLKSYWEKIIVENIRREK